MLYSTSDFGLNPKTEIEPRIRLRRLLRQGYEGQEGFLLRYLLRRGYLLRQGFGGPDGGQESYGGQDDGQVARMGTDDERLMETIFKPVQCILKSVKIRAIWGRIWRRLVPPCSLRFHCGQNSNESPCNFGVRDKWRARKHSASAFP